MSTPAEMAERHGRMLAELGELGLALARDLQARALAAETPQEAAGLADSFHRIARSVRQSGDRPAGHAAGSRRRRRRRLAQLGLSRGAAKRWPQIPAYHS